MTLRIRQVDVVRIAARSINYLTRMAPPEEGYIPFFGGKVPWRDVAFMEHCFADYGDGVGRLLEALALVRRVTGSDVGMDRQEGMLDRMLSFYDDDGVTYRRADPWSKRESGPYEMRSSLLALIALYEDGRHDLEEAILHAVRGIDTVYSPALLPGAEGAWDGTRWQGPETGTALQVIDALVRCYEATGLQHALDVARRFVEYYFFNSQDWFAPDGALVIPTDDPAASRSYTLSCDYEPSKGHFHTRSCAATGLARFGLLTNDAACLDKAASVHDQLIAHGTRFGWFPENMCTAGIEVSEMCDTVDIMEVQCLLAQTGRRDLYELTERYIKNHVAVCQFTPDQKVRATVRQSPEKRDPTGCRRYHDVLEMLSGGFVCVTYPDDLYTAYPGSRTTPNARYLIDISGCCSGSGAKAAYVAWQHAITETDDRVDVNLLITRSHPAADVVCSEGEIFTIAVESKKRKAISVRIPEWTQRDRIRVSQGGADVVWTEQDGYLLPATEAIARGAVEITMPAHTCEEREQVSDHTYTVKWCGSVVTDTVCDAGTAPHRNPYSDSFNWSAA